MGQPADTKGKGTRQGLAAEIVLTGGPCSGKTYSLPFLRAELNTRGYRVLVVPEIASRLYTGGVGDVAEIAASRRQLYVATQRTMIELYQAERRIYRRYADEFTDEPVVILYDRAELDGAAYLSEEEFAQATAEVGARLEDFLSYDAVIHLRTAAGTPYADLGNNAGRRELNTEEAVCADERTLAAWQGHPHLYVVDAESSFGVKLEKIVGNIERTLKRRLAARPAA
jgi:thymidylate kinase